MKKSKEKNIKMPEISIWDVFVYFIVFCIIGFFIETIYAFITKGVVESRKGFMYGPFCPIYGVGGVLLAIFLQYFKKNNITLFFGGMLIGSVVEYLISFIGETLFNVKWWDYSYMTFNINGRICLLYSIFWGLLAIPFMKIVYVYMQNFASYLEKRMGSVRYAHITSICMTFMMIDCLITMFALRVFSDRLVYTYDIDIADKEEVIEEYQRFITNEQLKEFVDKTFSNEKMLRTFPNLTITKKDGTREFASTFVTSITPYYYKIKPTNETIMYKLSKIKERIINNKFFILPLYVRGN